jgi:nitroimidazol reductase NimA-like FMN-containing flavoprotein (pyridoxamine 5'-phosphate oxidase superfamily)
MSVSMSRSERDEFLAAVHVGVLGVSDGGNGPLAVPVWYSYAPGGTVNVVTGTESIKAHLIDAAERFSLCAQSEVAPYKYVSVEGPVVARGPVDPSERRSMAHRYLGAEFGDAYIAATEDDSATGVTFRMMPEHWRATDFGKEDS